MFLLHTLARTRDEDGARSGANDLAAVRSRNETIERAAIARADDEEIGVAVAREMNELAIHFSDDDVTLHAPSEVVRDGLTNVADFVELAIHVDVHVLGRAGQRRHVHRMHDDVGVTVSERSSQK